MRRVLFTANLDSFFYKFLIPYLKWFKEQGFEVHVASNGEDYNIPYCDKKFNVCFARTPFTLDNIKSYNELSKILKENHYDIIHCHTPLGGVITRLAAKKYKKKGTRIIYTAHGFHFFKGAPIQNWLLYYTSEKYLAKFTDTIITINQSDYNYAQKFKAKRVFLIHGIGADEKKFEVVLKANEKEEIRKSLGLSKEDFVMLYPAEINKNKNQIMLINVMELLVKKNSRYKLLLPGQDSLNGKLQKIVKEKGLEKNIKFLGFRKDIPKLLQITNLAVSVSKREGLPINIIEAMYAGIPVICTNTRGQADLIKNNINGIVCEVGDVNNFVLGVEKMFKDKKRVNEIGKKNKEDVKKYLLKNVLKEMEKIYLEEIKGDNNE